MIFVIQISAQWFALIKISLTANKNPMLFAQFSLLIMAQWNT
jgi:hypothetical protein